MAYAVANTHDIKEGIILQNLDASSTTQMHPLGYSVETTDGRAYTYAELESTNVVTHAGYPAYHLSNTSGCTWYVTSDQSDAQETDGTDGPIGNAFAGLFACACAATHGTTCFLWLQTKGRAPDASVSTGVAAQEGLIAQSDNYLDTYSTAAQSSSHIIGYALETDTNAAADVMLLEK